MSKKKTLIIAGGGTAGHLNAGIAIADAWKVKFGDDARILFIGAKGRIEEDLVPRSGYQLETLSMGALNRVGLFRKLLTLIQLPLAFLKSYVLMIKYQPDVVVGVGGYSSGPVLFTAKLWAPAFGTKTAILEQNAAVGMTNRHLGKMVDWIFCNFEGDYPSFPKKKIRFLGNPIRSTMKALPSAREKFTIFIFGGSQGAVGINSLVIESLPFLESMKDQIKIVHQTGKIDFERVKKAYEGSGFSVEVKDFIYEMEKVYASASLIICRAGASSLAELAAVRRTGVLIPLPTSADNHQMKNARVYEAAGAAKVLDQNKTSGKELAGVIRAFVTDPSLIKEMEHKVESFHRPYAAVDIMNAVLS